jgi:hypothetical protein
LFSPQQAISEPLAAVVSRKTVETFGGIFMMLRRNLTDAREQDRALTLFGHPSLISHV